MEKLIVNSPSFEDFGLIPNKHTGFFEDVSPEFNLENIDSKGVSIAIIMDDLDIPFKKLLNHWIIWNIPVSNKINEGIHGDNNGIVQGIGYGKNRYRGPKQPFFIRKYHRYRFTFYILDTLLDLKETSKRKDLLNEMEGHILQEACLTGKHKRKMATSVKKQ